MNNSEFLQRLSDKLDVPVGQTDSMVRQFLEVFAKEVSSGKVVSIQGFGNFETREKAERKMFNPATKAYRIIPKKVALNFKMSTTLKDRINEK